MKNNSNSVILFLKMYFIVLNINYIIKELIENIFLMLALF